MKIVTNILNRFGYQKRSGTSGTYNPAQWLIDWISGGSETSSGLRVMEKSALQYTPFWAAVRIISGTVASLPFKVYRRLENGGKQPEQKHAAYRLLHDRPNEYMDALTFIETRQAHVLTYGNGFAEIQRDGSGRPIALWPLLPDRTERKMSAGGIPYYEVRSQTGETAYLPDYNVLHIKGLGFDGYTGYNVVAYHKEAIGYGQAVKEYGARFFGNDSTPGGILEHPSNLSKEAGDRLKKTWSDTQGGLKQSHRIAILEEGMKWTKMGVDPEQAQALEVQKYTVEDCSRIFQIPPHKLGSTEHTSYSSNEENNIDFITMTMLYWFRKWEEEVNYKLLLPSEQSTMFCEILADALLRGNTVNRYNAYNVGRMAGFLSVNDIREKENMNPIGPEGDIYLEPLNMKPAGTDTPVPAPTKWDSGRVRLAHRDMMVIAFNRVIQKLLNAKKTKNGFYDESRRWAADILFEPANAFALLNGVETPKATERLTQVLNDEINEARSLKLGDADRLADRLMREIGGGN
jgi:HK97 family phage portal protein